MRKRIAWLALVVTGVVLLCACGQRVSAPTTGTNASSNVTTTETAVITTTADSLSSMGESTTDTTTQTLPSVSKTVKTTTTTKRSTTKSTTAKPSTTKPTVANTPTVLPSEMRGAWVSYIELNALFSKCATAAQAKAAIDNLFDMLADARINVIFFHVRANSDAYYDSAIFKAASSVSKLLSAGFDPLTYAVEAAHKRSMQLHAWVNPYRVGFNSAYVVKDVPTFKDTAGRYYYAPTSTTAQALILDGIRELLNNYAIDGVQYDDYFYPSDGSGDTTNADLRRAGVDALVSGTYTLVKSKGKVFGVSPAHNADNTYNKLYADVKKWMSQSGYVDYICPQLYFGFEHSTAALDKMVATWKGYPRHTSVKLCVGLALYKIGLKSDTYAGAGKTEWADNTDIMKRSVQYLRQQNIKGIFFYCATVFDPTTCAVVDFKNDSDLAVAKKEIENLLSVL
ncbi:MAG: family 10 glycosylhydrolase [Clostridia bacterium]|nr:family 10 glycosylhydrolase [Clostridia bacterium]